jgi:hypothetical protein
MTTLDLIVDAGVLEPVQRPAARIALGPFGRWLTARGLGVRDITEAVIDAYANEAPAPERGSTRASLLELLAVLRESGACRPVSLDAGGAHQQLLNEFRRYLTAQGQRDLAAAVQRFLGAHTATHDGQGVPHEPAHASAKGHKNEIHGRADSLNEASQAW